MRIGCVAFAITGWILGAVSPAEAGVHPVRQLHREAEFTPADCTEVFADVPASNLFCPWIEQLAADGVNAGCGEGNFCPDQPVTRQQLALYLEKAMRGTLTWDVDADTLDGIDSSEFLTAASLNWASFRRRFYLSINTANGAGALEACLEPGFHMASIWEIVDLSNLVYDTSIGYLRPDSGNGPPTESTGWVRTGDDDGSVIYSTNCMGWTSVAIDPPDIRGTAAFLPRFSEYSTGPTQPWARESKSCANSISVWCVQD
jgi:hypothetical protein